MTAIADVCPHRGGSLRRGDCHYPGTIACPYHGWVFDARGECVAVLSEGPDSRIPGKVRSRIFPTRTLKGMVFVWMGAGTPAPIEQDVPPEFFEGDERRRFAGSVSISGGVERSHDRLRVLPLARQPLEKGQPRHRQGMNPTVGAAGKEEIGRSARHHAMGLPDGEER